MDDRIINGIMEILSGVVNLGGSKGGLTEAPQTFNPAIYNGVNAIAENVVMPIGYVILSLIFVLELYQITVRTEYTAGSLGLEVPFRAMFKFVICKTLIDSTPLILAAIFEISNVIITGAGNTLSTGVSAIDTAVFESSMREALGNMDFSVKLLTLMEVTILGLIFKFSTLVADIIIIGRMFEIYIMTAIAAIPMATLGNADASSIGKNFLKSFAAVCLQGALIFIVLALFNFLLSGIASEITMEAGDITSLVWQPLLYSLVLVVSLFSTGRISKSICNAM